jgi:type VI secretion system secreted protein Hcp
MAVDAFLYFDTSAAIKGESIDAQHGAKASPPKGPCLQIDSFSFSAEAPASAETGTGLGAGKLKFNEFAFKTKSSTASASVYKNMTLGTHIPLAKLYLRKAGGGSSSSGGSGQADFLIYTFKQLVITKWGLDGGSEDPVEDMSFAYTSMNMEYWQQDGSGKLSRYNSWGYDVKQNAGSEST